MNLYGAKGHIMSKLTHISFLGLDVDLFFHVQLLDSVIKMQTV